MAALLSVALIPVQVAVFITWPPPSAVADWFALFQRSWLLGLLSLDLLYLLNNALLVLIYLGLYAALRQGDDSWLVVALALGFIGIAAYYASNVSFEMLTLSNHYAGAATEAQRNTLSAAGHAMLATYTGTAFDVYYVLNAVALLIIAATMLRSGALGRAAAYSGLLAAILMAIPSSAGEIGKVFALASLLPWIVFCILIAQRMLRLTRAA